MLYVWTIRHPASGYVQGINDLVTPFFSVFLSQYIGQPCFFFLLLFFLPPLPLIGNGTEFLSFSLSLSLFPFHFVPDGDPDGCDITAVEQDILDIVEADSYWCLSKLVDGIQDNYTTSQPGIQRQVYKLKELIGRIDGLRHSKKISIFL